MKIKDKIKDVVVIAAVLVLPGAIPLALLYFLKKKLEKK
jgi:hypothetical protein